MDVGVSRGNAINSALKFLQNEREQQEEGLLEE